MKNKKGGIESINLAIIIIFGTLVLVFLIWGFLTNWYFFHEPPFKITKEGEVIDAISDFSFLTTEWFDENCNCTNHCKELVEIWGDDTYTECYSKRCFEYECGDYIIEVKRR